MRLIIDRRVFLDLEYAMEYYLSEVGADIAREFYNEFRRCQRLIADGPLALPVVRDGIRRINFHRFPYHLLYKLGTDESLTILVLKHDRRDPDIGLDR